MATASHLISRQFIYLWTFAALLTLLQISHASQVATSEKSRAQVLAAANVPEPLRLPVPVAAVALPEEGEQTNVSIRLSQAPQSQLSVRRVSHNDGRLYLEIRASQGRLSDAAEIQ